MTSNLSGSTALVTGATAGIGEATAVMLADRGASVIVHGRPTPDCACYHTGPSVPDPRIAEHVRFHAPVQIED